MKFKKKTVVSSDFISFDFCNVSCFVVFLGFFGGDVSSFFLVEISLLMFFCRDVSSICLVGKCLLRQMFW